MSEENKEEGEGKKPEKPAGSLEEGDKSQTVKDTERIRAETEELEKAIANQANAKARLNIGGGSEAGKPPEDKKETPQDYVKNNFENLR